MDMAGVGPYSRSPKLKLQYVIEPRIELSIIFLGWYPFVSLSYALAQVKRGYSDFSFNFSDREKISPSEQDLLSPSIQCCLHSCDHNT